MPRVPPRLGPNAQRYLDTLLATVEADLGHTLPLGTTLVPAADRAESGIATCYPFGDRSAVWCDPDVVGRLAPVVVATPLSARDFVTRAVNLGAAVRGIGVNRVLDGPLLDPQIDLGGVTIRSLDRSLLSDVALITDLRGAVSDDDAEEADFDLDNLDPHIVGAVDLLSEQGGERLLACASARLADSVPFDDIGVIAHPAARRRGLGVACVHRLVESRVNSGTPPMYRCEADNTGSNRIAQRLGFGLTQTIGSVRFGT